MNHLANALALILTILLPLGCGSSGAPAEETSSRPTPVQAIPDQAGSTQPLKTGMQAPAAVLRDPEGERFDLSRAYSRKPTILIFYRGGWCPYCNDHLGQIASVETELVRLGYQVLAVSPDRPGELAKTQDKQGLEYELLSDSDMKLARSFGLAFRVDDMTLKRYRGYGIDLNEASGREHHMLPVPAVYIVDTDGVIGFAHWDTDYKQRLDAQVLVERAREIAAQEKPASELGD
jgi:peroxiredoxin